MRKTNFFIFQSTVLFCSIFCTTAFAGQWCEQGAVANVPGNFGPWGKPQHLLVEQKLINERGLLECGGNAYITAPSNTIRWKLSGMLTGSTRMKNGGFMGDNTYFVKPIDILPGAYQQVVYYQWNAGADSGGSTLNVYSFRSGKARIIFHAEEMDGQLRLTPNHNGFTISGFQSTSCMACGYSASAAWQWNPTLGGFTLISKNPKAVSFARYLNAPATPFVAGENPHSAYNASVQGLHRLNRKILTVYQQVGKKLSAPDQARLRQQQVRWVEKKRKICGTQANAERFGHLLQLDCLKSMTRDRIISLQAVPYSVNP